MKLAPKALIAVYLVILLWLVLFKFSYDIFSVLLNYQSQQINLTPFADTSKSEMISNLIVFIPLGLLFSVNFKSLKLRYKLLLTFLLSATIEATQFLLAIGVTDITDILTNTLGGLVGLLAYDLARRNIDTKRIDKFITVSGFITVTLFLILRVFVFKVQY